MNVCAQSIADLPYDDMPPAGCDVAGKASDERRAAVVAPRVEPMRIYFPVTWRIARYRLVFRARQELSEPPFIGAYLRGQLGSALYRLVCMNPRQPCEGCTFRGPCAYPLLFEPHASHSEMRRFADAPRPFVLEPWRAASVWPAGEERALHLLLIGPAIPHLDIFIAAMRQVAWQGLGAVENRCELRSVSAVPLHRDSRPVRVWTSRERVLFTHDLSIPLAALAPSSTPHTKRLIIRALTSLRLKVNGDFATLLQFRDIVRAALDRIDALSRIYGGGALRADFEGLVAVPPLKRHLVQEPSI